MFSFSEHIFKDRWESLRNRAEKIPAVDYEGSSSEADEEESQYQYQQQLERLRSHMKPQK